ncbi:DUF6580 family putative transport protein [Pseudohongiella sp.]|uniref:Rod shape-determining protein MreD n=1 Tax=marine sediment metagenome TaxID=412755 RepID=A0A0F9YAI5_9ZZZZ|nr:DUF6580 family putative transport protein [Pseudohongiella sp.]HDZ07973.1 hypothetical protein [Pseudohongiella sp.]HEA64420.1 hypothetical protein [Pseudohongiella sp.]
MPITKISHRQKSELFTIVALIVVVAAMRLLPHPMNVTPIGALGLFAGALLPSRTAWLLPMGALLLSDMINGFYALPAMALVYAGFWCSAVIGRVWLARRRTPERLIGAVLASATVFFIISNLSAWLMYYPRTLEGFVQCYISAIPFFGRSLLGDALYATLLFGLYEYIRRFQPQWRTA